MADNLQIESFKEFVNEACKEIALVVRSTESCNKDFEARKYVAECAEKWFENVDELTEAEFMFIAQKELMESLMKGVMDDTMRDDSESLEGES